MLLVKGHLKDVILKDVKGIYDIDIMYEGLVKRIYVFERQSIDVLPKES
jgi:hypothetical protein